ncbi:MAG: cellulase family glycosylhydrolase, partial [Ruminiclostridium sp.]|nr:cellulase family glycosylhydrolase [Ruminiclostridium sp.]
MGTAIVGLTAALIITNLPEGVPAVQENSAVTTTVAETTISESETETQSSETVTEQMQENTTTTTQEAVTAVTDEQTVTEAQTSTAAQTSAADTMAATTTAATTAKTEAPKEGITLEYSVDNSWESGSELMYGVQFGITNNGGSNVSGWELVMEIDGLSSCQGWNGTYTVSGNTLTVTNAEYNGDIGNGGTIVVGCNLGTTKAFSVKSAKLNGVSCSVSEGYVDQNAQNNQNNNQDNNQQNNQNNQTQTADVSELLKRSENAVQGDDWLFTDGNRIVDKNGKRVWLTGVNWFGYNTGTNTFDGLWNSQLKPSVEAIADHGFNLIRVPISAELINQWAAGEYPRANYNNAYNPELNEMNSLQIFDYFLKLAEENGIKVMPDIHSAETNASGHNVNLWYTSKVTVEDYYSALEWMADRYKDNDTIIAFDLKNEPHGKPYEGDGAAIWNDSKDANNWKYVAETAAARILAKNPNVLILVEGTEIYPMDLATNSDYHSTNDKEYYFNWWGGNLRGVKDYPIDLGKYQNKLVYSPHDYGPTVYKQPWFEGNYTFDSLMKDCWRDNWFYIHEDKTAPLLIGEWGGFMREPNLTWMTYMRKLIKDNKLNHTFWCFNANSGDTGGLVLDDFTTWDEEKYAFVKEVLWQENGKFVGLDHAIPLGDNGITLE